MSNQNNLLSLQWIESRVGPLIRQILDRVEEKSAQAVWDLLLAMLEHNTSQLNQLDAISRVRNDDSFEKFTSVNNRLSKIEEYLDDTGLIWEDVTGTLVTVEPRLILELNNTVTTDHQSGGTTTYDINEWVTREIFLNEGGKDVALDVINPYIKMITIHKEGWFGTKSGLRIVDDCSKTIPMQNVRLYVVPVTLELMVEVEMSMIAKTDIDPGILYGREKTGTVNVINQVTPFAISHLAGCEIFVKRGMYEVTLTPEFGQLAEITDKFFFIGEDVGERNTYVKFNCKVLFRLTNLATPYTVYVGDVMYMQWKSNRWRVRNEIYYQENWKQEIKAGGQDPESQVPTDLSLTIETPLNQAMDVIDFQFAAFGPPDKLGITGQATWTTAVERLVPNKGQQFSVILKFRASTIEQKITKIEADIAQLKADVSQLRQMVDNVISVMKANQSKGWRFDLSTKIIQGFYCFIKFLSAFTGPVALLIWPLAEIGEQVTLFTIDHTIFKDKTVSVNVMDVLGDDVARNFHYYSSQSQSVSAKDILGQYLVDELERVHTTYKEIWRKKIIPSETLPLCSYWTMPLVPVLGEFQAKLVDKFYPSTFGQTRVPVHGNAIARFPYLDGVVWKRKCILVNVGSDAEGEQSKMERFILTLKNDNLMNIFEWTNIWEKTNDTWAWDHDPKEVTRYTEQSGARKQYTFPGKVDYVHGKAFYETMKKLEGGYNLFTHNCQDMAQLFLDFIMTGRIPDEWRDVSFGERFKESVDAHLEPIYPGFSTVKANYL